MNALKKTLGCVLAIPIFLCLFSFKNDGPDLAALINKALAAGQKRINIPKGTYYLKMENAEPLRFANLKNVEINGNGSEIITRLPSRAINIENCENFKLTGFSIDCELLPFTQGKIVAMDAGRNWWDVEIMDGYPIGNIESLIPDRVQIFDPKTNNLRKDLYTYGRNTFSKVEKLERRKFRIHKARSNPSESEAVGDYVVMSLDFPNVEGHSVVISKSKNVQLEDIIIYSGNCFGFYEEDCESNSYNRCQITKKLNDPKVKFPRLRSINADAFHSKFATVGPTVTNCVFMYHGDDCIAINTRFYKVIGSKGKTVDISANLNELKMKVGNTIRFVDFSGTVVGDAVVTDINNTTDFSQAGLDKVNEIFKMAQEDKNQVQVTRLSLDRIMNVEAGGVVSSLSMGGSGFVVKNNKVGYTRARGILIKSSDGVISGNTVEGCELGGIVLSPELFWMEAGFSRNILIENNIVKDCMFANSGYGIEQAAPISVIAVNVEEKVAPAGGFKNIKIINNTIINSPLPAMIITSADGVVVKGNRIDISKDIIRKHGRKFGVDNTKVIWLKNTNNVTIDGKLTQ